MADKRYGEQTDELLLDGGGEDGFNLNTDDLM